MGFRFLKYTSVLVIPGLTVLAILSSGWLTFSTVIFSYAMIPAMEFLFNSDQSNLEEQLSNSLVNDRKYDYLLYAMVPVLYGVLSFYLWTITHRTLTTLEYTGMTISMGINCGVLGINVAHELGHRKSKFDQFMAKLLLLSSLYLHFIIEHNRGHHKYVSTPQDPASARKGETVHVFWFRSIVMAYISAWKIEGQRLKKLGQKAFSLKNEMLQFQLLQITFIAVIYLVFGWWGMIGFLSAALIGIFQLETVNYIEHYGLSRKEISEGRYERVQPWHSWNSNHVVGRLMLFELSRHSDHHYLASKKYQVLDHHEGSPQMPTGYPGMMVLSLIPPLWFNVMHKKLNTISEITSEV